MASREFRNALILVGAALAMTGINSAIDNREKIRERLSPKHPIMADVVDSALLASEAARTMVSGISQGFTKEATRRDQPQEPAA